MRSFGYQIAVDGPNVEVEQNGVSADISIIQVQAPTPTSPVAALVLSRQYEFPNALPTFKLLEAAGNVSGWNMTSSLGGILSLRAEIDLGHGLTNERLKNEMGGLLYQLSVLHSTLVEPLNGSKQPYGPPSKKPRVNLDSIVYYMSTADMMYLVDAWSWTFEKSYGPGGSTWMTMATVLGEDVTFTGVADPGSRSICPGLRLTAQIYPPKDVDPLNWLRRPRSAQADVSVGVSPDSEPPCLQLTENIDFSNGLSLRDLKRKIENFAKAEQAVKDSKD